MSEKTPGRPILPVVGLLFVSFVWGSTFPGGKYILGALPVFTYMTARFVMAAAILLPLSWKELKAARRRDYVISGLLGLVLFTTLSLQTVALLYTTASKSSFALGIYVVLVPLLSFILYKKPLSLKIIGACLLAMAGLGLISTGEGLEGGVDLGVIITLIGAFFLALQIVGIGRYAKEVSPMTMAFCQTLVVALLCLPISLFLENNPPLASVDLSVWLCCFFLAAFATAISYIIQCSAQRHLDQALVAIIVSMSCVFGAFQSWLFLGEAFTWSMFAGGGLLFLAMIVAQLLGPTKS